MYYSPTYGSVDIAKLKKQILKFMSGSPESRYKLVIGTDSQNKNGKGCDFITAIIVHRQGEGGIYFWRRIVEKNKMVLRNRIYKEASLSLSAADEFLDIFKKNGISKYDLEIHVDIGKFGETRTMLAEVVGMIRGSGYKVKTKPFAYGASCVADKHT